MEILNVFNTLPLKQVFWKTKTLFKKLEHYFLVENTKIGNVSFPYNSIILEADVKTKRMVSPVFLNQVISRRQKNADAKVK